ncbi:MAG: hypothetical protein JXR76_08605 [Deltaproteobacteria bacterium]|nr:hypothetical protein [Deltaproteobacteria bacterium]
MEQQLSHSISVGELAEFVWRAGDLKQGRDGPGAQEGARAHRQLQKARTDFQSEVPFRRQVTRYEITLAVSGRADLVCDHCNPPIIEEIKTTLQSPLLIDGNNPVHWAQVKLYGHMFAKARGGESFELRVTYYNPETEQLRTFSNTLSAVSLDAFFQETTGLYMDWMAKVWTYRQQRNESLKNLPFPFATQRSGQGPLAKAVTNLPHTHQRLFAEAPTGSGKTMAIVYGALCALAQDAISQILFLTARTVGREAAEGAGQIIAEKGAQLKILSLVARDDMCIMAKGTRCGGDDCALAKGHFDRVRGAMDALFEQKSTSTDTVKRVANAHHVCAYWLCRAMAPFVDLIVGDYNYFFDPGATLLTLTAPISPPRMLLVDEAHNLPDRARQMFTAALFTHKLSRTEQELSKQYAFPKKCLNRLHGAISAAGQHVPLGEKRMVKDELSNAITVALDQFIDAMSACLQDATLPLPENLLTTFFDTLAFVRAVANGGDGDRLITAKESTGEILTHFCLDPAPKLKQVLKKSGALAVFFSATLSPIEYYRRILGGDERDRCAIFSSTFPPENRCVARSVAISTRYKDRTRTLKDVAGFIRTTVLSHPGNYLAFFPSFAYLDMVQSALDFANEKVDVLPQRPYLSDAKKQAFLAKFRTKRRQRHLLGLAVLGGLFGEGIDLPGNQLIGTVVVSPGLPMVSFEQELIRTHFEQTDRMGFQYAYQYPGMNKVIQAAGRVLRHAKDKGVILFIGERFAQRSYAILLEKPWPEIRSIKTPMEWQALLDAFWGG